jgi:sugar lactone lactonase YvrE
LTIDRVVITPLARTDGELRLQMPRHDCGYADISLRNASSAASGAYLYLAPRLEELLPGYITTVAGIGSHQRDFGVATEAPVNPREIAFDSAGNLLITQPADNTVLRLKPNGTIERLAGSGSAFGPPGDGGSALDAEFDFPTGVAVDASDNVYFVDHRQRIRRVDARTGIISTVAGSGVAGFSGDDGAAEAARIDFPSYIAIDGDNLYFLDVRNHRIRRVRNGIITTVAGNGIDGFSGDGGPATQAAIDLGDGDTGGIAVDSAGNIYFADVAGNRIRRVDTHTGIITTFLDAPPSNNSLYAGDLLRLTFDRAGNLYFSGGGKIVEVSASGQLIRSWQGSRNDPSLADDVPFAQAFIGHVTGLKIDGNGDIIYADDQLLRVRRLSVASGRITTIAGIGPRHFGADGPAVAAFLYPNDLAFDSSNQLLIADGCCGPGGGGIRTIDLQGNLRTIAGSGIAICCSDNVPALHAPIAPVSLALDAKGGIDFTDFSQVYRLENGVVRIVTGRDADCHYDGDGGLARQAGVCQPWDAIRDDSGNLFIADTNNNRIRRVDAVTGKITTYAGTGPVNGHENRGHGGFCGDGGPAVDACLNTPYSLAFDRSGNLLFADWANDRIRKIDRSGIISTFAEVFSPFTIMADAYGSLYLNTSGRIVRFNASGVPTTIAGDAHPGFAGDGGLATEAKIAKAMQVAGIAIDQDGNLFFCDQTRVRAIRYGAVLAPPNARIEARATGSTVNATVFDADNHAAPGVRVDFSAPSAGASCGLSRLFAVTDANGVASVSCTSNCVKGTFTVTARPVGSSAAAALSFTNSSDSCRRRSVRH